MEAEERIEEGQKVPESEIMESQTTLMETVGSTAEVVSLQQSADVVEESIENTKEKDEPANVASKPAEAQDTIEQPEESIIMETVEPETTTSTNEEEPTCTAVETKERTTNAGKDTTEKAETTEHVEPEISTIEAEDPLVAMEVDQIADSEKSSSPQEVDESDTTARLEESDTTPLEKESNKTKTVVEPDKSTNDTTTTAAESNETNVVESDKSIEILDETIADKNVEASKAAELEEASIIEDESSILEAEEKSVESKKSTVITEDSPIVEIEGILADPKPTSPTTIELDDTNTAEEQTEAANSVMEVDDTSQVSQKSQPSQNPPDIETANVDSMASDTVSEPNVDALAGTDSREANIDETAQDKPDVMQETDLMETENSNTQASDATLDKGSAEDVVMLDADDNAVDSTTKTSTSTEPSKEADIVLLADELTTEKTKEKEPSAPEKQTSVSEKTPSVSEKQGSAEKDPNSESIFPDFARSASTTTETKEDSSKPAAEEKYIISNCNEEVPKMCMQCNLENLKPKYNVNYQNSHTYLCSEYCFNNFKDEHPNNYVKRELRVKVFAAQERTTSFAPTLPVLDFQRVCRECSRLLKEHEISVSWEAYEFCNERCLLKYQKTIGSNCFTCKCDIPDNIIGKYCVRFGTLLKQFCSTTCLEKNKKELKVCAFCQEDLSLSTKTVENYCSTQCLMKDKNIQPDKKKEECAVCHHEKPVEIEFKQENNKVNYFCGDPCFVAYKFVNNVVPGQCENCGTYVNKSTLKENSIHYNGIHYLCSKKCQSIYIVSNRKILLCYWCKVKKYNFDMVEQRAQNGQEIAMCSVNCLKIFHVSITSVKTRKHNCDQCKKYVKAIFQLALSDKTTRHFCSYVCLLTYQANNPVSIQSPTAKKAAQKEDPIIRMPVISHVQSLATTATSGTQVNGTATTAEIEKKIRQLVFVKPQAVPKQRNMATMVKPNMVSKSIAAKPKEVSRGVQTDKYEEVKGVIPVPFPVFVPTPVHMYCQYVPMPVPFPLPIPVPVFIPTTRNSVKGIMKEINKIKTKVPADPLEAELLMMAELVAEDKKNDSDSSSEEEKDNSELPLTPVKSSSFSESMDTTPQFGEDMLQMALTMATDFTEPVDLEGEVSATAISAPAVPPVVAAPTPKRRGRPPKYPKKPPKAEPLPITPTVILGTGDKPDANLCLKYTFGVNAWKQWVTTKNAELEKSPRRVKLFKTEILQLTADELNFSLCLFVKEVRKPNGSEYAPDTIYYLCLGIQQYLYENGRIDNIFCDAFYEKFTDCLNEVCRKFSVLYNDSQYIVTRVEEEHLWESKQLGAHSPLVLINTLMFFNTKHFCLTTVDEHLQLSFSHIMKHWKRNANSPGSRNVLLRFYPPPSAVETRKKKMYEQQENEENPLRCPVKLYEFYLSKCPESVKTRNDVFYLLPERSCVPDSPLWYSTMALERETLEKMLNRVKMVKEINVALLTS